MTEGCSIWFLGRRHNLARPRLPKTRSWNISSMIWRAIENWGFNQIQNFFHRISLNSKWIRFSEKKNWEVRCTLIYFNLSFICQNADQLLMKFHTHFMITCFMTTWSKKISHVLTMSKGGQHFTWKWCEITMWNACNFTWWFHIHFTWHPPVVKGGLV